MGMFAFRRMREREAASSEAASFAQPVAPTMELEPLQPKRRKPAKPRLTDGDSN
jgi:hypothetical protein